MQNVGIIFQFHGVFQGSLAEAFEHVYSLVMEQVSIIHKRHDAAISIQRRVRGITGRCAYVDVRMAHIASQARLISEALLDDRGACALSVVGNHFADLLLDRQNRSRKRPAPAVAGAAGAAAAHAQNSEGGEVVEGGDGGEGRAAKRMRVGDAAQGGGVAA